MNTVNSHPKNPLRALFYAGVVALCVTTLSLGGCYTRTIVPAQK